MSERYPGEPAPVDMLRDLQRAVYGETFASPYPPADLWAHMIEMVANRDLPENDVNRRGIPFTREGE